MKLVAFEVEHLELLEKQRGKPYSFLNSDQRIFLASNGLSYSVISKSGRILMCAGIQKHWEHRGEGWAMFDLELKKEFIGVHRIVKRFLDVTPFRRVEATVEANFEPGHRWAKLLGFEMEAPRLKNYFVNGADAVLYVRIRTE